MYKLKLEHHFDAAHKLENYEGACANLHGHRWNVIIEIETEELLNGMIIDFKEVKGIINEFDHKTILQEKDNNTNLINTLISEGLQLVVVKFNPTAENLSKVIKERIDRYLVDKVGQENFKVSIELFESPNASIKYYD